MILESSSRFKSAVDGGAQVRAEDLSQRIRPVIGRAEVAWFSKISNWILQNLNLG